MSVRAAEGAPNQHRCNDVARPIDGRRVSTHVAADHLAACSPRSGRLLANWGISRPLLTSNACGRLLRPHARCWSMRPRPRQRQQQSTTSTHVLASASTCSVRCALRSAAKRRRLCLALPFLLVPSASAAISSGCLIAESRNTDNGWDGWSPTGYTRQAIRHARELSDHPLAVLPRHAGVSGPGLIRECTEASKLFLLNASFSSVGTLSSSNIAKTTKRETCVLINRNAYD